MHCFTGSATFANKLLDLDAFFSASGIITFKNSLELQDTFKTIPLNRLLVETDSPFLAPIPMRGKKNEPSFVKYTLEKLSLIKNQTIKDMSNLTTDNFPIDFFWFLMSVKFVILGSGRQQFNGCIHSLSC